ncbi:MAG: tetratricopeptide repeat protein, partial [Candidatus Omnitrophota bacterium]
MMRIPQIRTSVIFLLWCIAAECATGYAAVGASGNVRAGNRLYRDGKLDAALEKYHAASAALPDSDIVNFDIGAAWYKKEEYQKAAESFTKALTSEHKKIEADALYNLGNCKYKLGKLKENTDLATCVGLLRESLDYYKRAVAIDQKNADARFNHEVIERELKVLLDKMKKEPQQDQDKQEKKSQEQKEETKQGSGSADKQAGEKGKDNTGKKEEQAGQQQKKEEARQEQKNGPDAQAGKKEAGEKNKG